MSILGRLGDECSARLIPAHVSLELTYRCNERCGHCYLATYDDRASGRAPLSTERWLSILDELAEAGTLFLILTGGEALLHPDFWAIAERASRLGFATGLITNGQLVDERAARRFAALGFSNVTVSLYSLEAEIHDRMTNVNGSHAQAIAALEHLLAAGVPSGINCLLTSANIDGYWQLANWAEARSLPISFDPAVTARLDGALTPTSLRASAQQLRAFYSELARRTESPSSQASLERPSPAPDAPVCNAARAKAAVSVHGELLGCLEVRTPLGDLKLISFVEAWSSEGARRIREIRNASLKMPGCAHCPGMAGAEAGDVFAPVLYLLEIERIRSEALGGA